MCSDATLLKLFPKGALARDIPRRTSLHRHSRRTATNPLYFGPPEGRFLFDRSLTILPTMLYAALFNNSR